MPGYSYPSPLQEATAGLNLGLSLAQGIRALQQDALLREKLKEEEDIHAAADLLNKRAEYANDPEKVRQLDTQFSGYSPKVRIQAAATYASLAKNKTDAIIQEFKAAEHQALRDFQRTQALAQKGLKKEALDVIADIQNKNLRDGYRYEYVQAEDGNFEHVIYNPMGEVVQRRPVKFEEELVTTATILARPDNAFKAFLDAEQKRIEFNANQMNDVKEFVDKDGKRYFSFKAIYRDNPGILQEVWFDETGRPIERPKESLLLKSRETVEKQESDKLAKEHKILENKLLQEKISANRLYMQNLAKSLENEKASDIKRFQEEVGNEVAKEMYRQHPNIEVDHQKGVVYRVQMSELSDKPVKIIDTQLTAQYLDDVEKFATLVVSKKEKDETPVRALYRIRQERQQEAARKREEDRKAFGVMLEKAKNKDDTLGSETKKKIGLPKTPAKAENDTSENTQSNGPKVYTWADLGIPEQSISDDPLRDWLLRVAAGKASSQSTYGKYLQQRSERLNSRAEGR